MKDKVTKHVEFIAKGLTLLLLLLCQVQKLYNNQKKRKEKFSGSAQLHRVKIKSKFSELTVFFFRLPVHLSVVKPH
jgi:hypothetical protein